MPKATTSDATVLELPLPRRRHMLIAYVVVLPLLLLASVVLGVSVWAGVLPKLGMIKVGELPGAILAILVVSLLTGGVWTLTLLLISGLIQDCFPRSLSLDFGSRQLTLSNVPGLTRVFGFDEIESLEILKCRAPKSGHWCVYLCVRRRGRRRLLRLVQAVGYRLDQVVEQKIMPYAVQIGELLSVPVNETVVNPLRTLWVCGF
jgi:hypothetical protein